MCVKRRDHRIIMTSEYGNVTSQINLSPAELFLFFYHLILELLTQFPASNNISQIELFVALITLHKLFFQF